MSEGFSVQRITALLAIGSLVVTACSSGVSAESTTLPPAAECIAIADETVAMLQDMIAAVEALPANELPDTAQPDPASGPHRSQRRPPGRADDA